MAKRENPESFIYSNLEDANTHSRILHDAELLRSGAKIILGRLEVTPEQYAAAHKEMNYALWLKQRTVTVHEEKGPNGRWIHSVTDLPAKFPVNTPDFLVRKADLIESGAALGYKRIVGASIWSHLISNNLERDWKTNEVDFREGRNRSNLALTVVDPSANWRGERVAIVGSSLLSAFNEDTLKDSYGVGVTMQDLIRDHVAFTLWELAQPSTSTPVIE